jgi:hypothetical protein
MADSQKTEKALSILKNYVAPTIIFICGISVAWATLSNSVESNALAIDKLGYRCEENEELINAVLQRLASIDTKLEYIVKEIDVLTSN